MYSFGSELELRESVHVPKGLQQSKSELFHDMTMRNRECCQTVVLCGRLSCCSRTRVRVLGSEGTQGRMKYNKEGTEGYPKYIMLTLKVILTQEMRLSAHHPDVAYYGSTHRAGRVLWIMDGSMANNIGGRARQTPYPKGGPSLKR